MIGVESYKVPGGIETNTFYRYGVNISFSQNNGLIDEMLGSEHLLRFREAPKNGYKREWFSWKGRLSRTENKTNIDKITIPLHNFIFFATFAYQELKKFIMKIKFLAALTIVALFSVVAVAQTPKDKGYVIVNTGNEDKLDCLQTKAGSKVVPSGRITIVDEHANGGKPFGVAGVRVSCNVFVKFDRAYTDRDGYYKMNKKFSAQLRYRLVFKNVKGFAVGLNLVLVPASVSTLGKSGPSGVNMTVTSSSDDKLFRRCVVNNAAYDYYSRCARTDMNINCPPSDLRIWIFNNMQASSAVMLHHGAVLPLYSLLRWKLLP